MSLQEWIAQNILQPATGGMHGVLSTAADRLRDASTSTSAPTPTPSVPTKPEPTDGEGDEKPTSLAFAPPPTDPDPIDAQIQRSRHVNPALRSHLAGLVARRKEKINLATLIKDPVDLRATDDVWDPEASAGGAGGGSTDAAPTIPLTFDGKWAERALRVAAERVEAYARKREEGGGEGVKMEVDDHAEEKGNGAAMEEEDEETRKLRFNLLALARVVPLSEGVTFA
ncbi:hypothetical protein M407DRAFT_196335 [Tulasnella calospora MUT 4182]|uniref:Uncharacterized protein n=1 Tax=Tulasnella calospora MUT 4182 TaxID=1051891 RepID=A0A0C3LZV7_9AGAM|nr:hypothetical protein M407DRAFT_196335 [Tulasnella calospora MUT 4182]